MVIHMLVYFSLTFACFHFYDNGMSAMGWRVFVLVTLILNFGSSLAPAIVRSESDGIRLNGESNPVYFTTVFLLCLFFVVILIRCYIEWSFTFSDLFLQSGYLCLVIFFPLLNLVFSKLYW